MAVMSPKRKSSISEPRRRSELVAKYISRTAERKAVVHSLRSEFSGADVRVADRADAKEVGDFSCAITDAGGLETCQSDHCPKDRPSETH